MFEKLKKFKYWLIALIIPVAFAAELSIDTTVLQKENMLVEEVERFCDAGECPFVSTYDSQKLKTTKSFDKKKLTEETLVIPYERTMPDGSIERGASIFIEYPDKSVRIKTGIDASKRTIPKNLIIATST